MRVFRVLLLVAVGAAALMLAAAPSVAQTGDAARVKQPKSYPIDPITGYPIPPGRKLVSNRVPAKVTVTRRSYLDPGTEVPVGYGSHMDYAFPPGGDPGRPYWYFGPDQSGVGGTPLAQPWLIPNYNPHNPF